LACLSYVCAALELPLRDREMQWLDRQLGFDWLKIMGGLDHWPWLLLLLDAAYSTFTFQLIATALLLLLARPRCELNRFFMTFICASILAEVASVLVPTLGPMAAVSDHFNNLPTLGRTTAHIVLSLREGTLKTIEFSAIDGIISFPSLHAAVAVIVPFTLRWSKQLFWPVAVLDGMMLLSAVPSGNHYFVDVIAGCTVAVGAIACATLLQPRLDRMIVDATAILKLCYSKPISRHSEVPVRLNDA
jgi:membrane-associated phospholipid phosphatase